MGSFTLYRPQFIGLKEKGRIYKKNRVLLRPAKTNNNLQTKYGLLCFYFALFWLILIIHLDEHAQQLKSANLLFEIMTEEKQT